MARPRLALWVLARADAPGAREALVGDLLEEMARGRSGWWVWQQVIGLWTVDLVAGARRQARVTPQLIVLLLGVLLLGGASVASPGRVLETWIGIYLCAGLLSLVADVTSRTDGSRMLVTPVGSGEAAHHELR